MHDAAAQEFFTQVYEKAGLTAHEIAHSIPVEHRHRVCSQIVVLLKAAADVAQPTGRPLIPVHDDDSHGRAMELVSAFLLAPEVWDAGSPEGIWLDAQTTLIEAYEKRRWPLGMPVPPRRRNVEVTAPHTIFLDIGEDADDCAFSQLHEVTWSQDDAAGDGIRYVRADLAADASTLSQEACSAARRLIELANEADEALLSTHGDTLRELAGKLSPKQEESAS